MCLTTSLMLYLLNLRVKIETGIRLMDLLNALRNWRKLLDGKRFVQNHVIILEEAHMLADDIVQRDRAIWMLFSFHIISLFLAMPSLNWLSMSKITILPLNIFPNWTRRSLIS